MSHASEHPVRCAGTGCSAEIPASRWDQVRAGDRGWFFQKDGTAWCPKHVPGWVPAWREAQARRQQKG